jgi:glycosyltransferase involved in cell wall biosynthesis
MSSSLQTPLFSICIPTYNGEAFIAETLKSVFSQDFPDYELIICDDCSKDNTVSLTNKLVEGRSNVKCFVNEKNLGLVENWNKCVSLSSGKYIKFLFQDDHLLSGALKYTSEVIQKHQPSFLTSKRKFTLPANVSEETANYYNVYLQKFENELGIKEDTFVNFQEIAKLVAAYIGINFIGEPSVFVFKRELFEKIGKFDKRYEQLCDLEFALRAIAGSELFYMNFLTCDFMIHDGSTTVTNINTKYFELEYFDYIKLSAMLLYDERFSKITKEFSFSQRSRVKLFLKNKIYSAMNDEKVTEKHRAQLKSFLDIYAINAVKTSFLYFLIGKVLKIKNA